jgi:hypothetical protein
MRIQIEGTQFDALRPLGRGRRFIQQISMRQKKRIGL